MNKHLKTLIFVSVVLIWVVTGCQPAANVPGPRVNIPLIDKAGPTPRPNSIPSPMSSPTATAAVSPSATFTLVPSPTHALPSATALPTKTSAAHDPGIAAAGDIACDPTDVNFNSGNGDAIACQQKYTYALMVNANLAGILALGDNQYFCGGYQAFLQSYDLSWGKLKAITHPVPGNHEYLTSGGTDCNVNNENAAGYFQYYGAAAGPSTKGWYSFNIGSWHLIALDSNCDNVGGCGPASPQGQWLAKDLTDNRAPCILAYWHIPLFSSGGRAATNSQAFWNVLYAHHADVILNGHDHIYERFAPQTPTGVPDPINGILQITAGTGGADHTTVVKLAANSVVTNADTFGVLEMTLHSNSYDWKFVPQPGKTFTDSGSGTCHTK